MLQVEHLENMMKLKEERIDELHKQLERKASRRKEVENMQNSINVPLNFNDNVPITPKASSETVINVESRKIPVLKNTLSYTKVKDVPKSTESEVKLPEKVIAETKSDGFVKIVEPLLEKKSEIVIEKNDLEVVNIAGEKTQEIEPEQKNSDEDFKDSIQDIGMTIEETIQREIFDITNTATEEPKL